LLLALERVEVDAAQGAIAAGSDHSA